MRWPARPLPESSKLPSGSQARLSFTFCIAGGERAATLRAEEGKPMTMIRATTLVIAFGFIGAVANAQDKKPAAAPPAAAPPAAAPAGAAAPPATGGGMMAAPKPAPEWEAFAKGWEGSWKCETTVPAGSMGPGSPEQKAQVNVKVKKDYGGFWLVGNYDMKKTK